MELRAALFFVRFPRPAETLEETSRPAWARVRMEAYNPTYRQLWDAAQQGRADEVREILRASKLHGGLERVCLEFALSVACRNNWPRAAQALLGAKARPDVWAHSGRHPSPLYAAALHGYVEVLRLLVLPKADVNQDCDCCTAYAPVRSRGPR
jgi:hypothetical protein